MVFVQTEERFLDVPYHRYSGVLRAEGTEITDLQFFSLLNLPENISPPDQPVIAKFTEAADFI